MYEPDGYMCATIVNGDRPDVERLRPNPLTPRRSRTTTPSLPTAGPTSSTAQRSTVTHYPEIAWEPAYVGSTQPRPFRLEGEQTDYYCDAWNLRSIDPEACAGVAAGQVEAMQSESEWSGEYSM